MVKSQAVPVSVVARPGTAYPGAPPFDPPNPVYEMVEAALRDLGLDRARAGTPEWNPLGDVIRPGDRVLVKPNFMASRNFHQPLRGDMLLCAATPGAVLRPILDYALRAAGPSGQVTLADVPSEGCSVAEVLRGTGVDSLIARYVARGHNLEFIDLRSFQAVPRMAMDDVRSGGRSYNFGLLLQERLAGDPRGYQVIDLRSRSRFRDIERKAASLRFRRTHPGTPVEHHSGGRHEYSIPKTVLAADAVINLAKMKTDLRGGVAMALMSALSLSNEPYWLPHYTAGTPEEDGDEFPVQPPLSVRIEHQLQRLPLPGQLSLIARAPSVAAPPNGTVRGYIFEGAWEGNDTLWRAALDLNDILLHADREGKMSDTQQRRTLCLIDGVLGGEGDGPVATTPRRAGILCAGQDPVLTDLVAARLMGLEPGRVPTIAQALKRPLLSSSREAALVLSVAGTPAGGAFIPPSTWPHLLRR